MSKLFNRHGYILGLLVLLMLPSVFAVSPTFNTTGGDINAENAIAYYPYTGGSLNDFSGNEYHLTNDGADIVSGILGNGYGFVTANEDGQRIDEFPFSFGTGSVDLPKSIGFWINVPDATPATQMNMLGKYSGFGSLREYLFELRSDGHLVFQLYDVSGDVIRTITDQQDFSDSTWHHVMITYDGSTTAGGLEIFVDGVKPSQTPQEVGVSYGVASASTQDVTFGARYTTDTPTGQFLEGSLDEAMFLEYEVNLTGASPTAPELYNNGFGVMYNGTGFPELVGGVYVANTTYNVTLNFTATNNSDVTSNDSSINIVTNNATDTASVSWKFPNDARFREVEFTLTNIEGSDTFSNTFTVDRVAEFNEDLGVGELTNNVLYNFTRNFTGGEYPVDISVNAPAIDIVLQNNGTGELDYTFFTTGLASQNFSWKISNSNFTFIDFQELHIVNIPTFGSPVSDQTGTTGTTFTEQVPFFDSTGVDVWTSQPSISSIVADNMTGMLNITVNANNTAQSVNIQFTMNNSQGMQTDEATYTWTTPIPITNQTGSNFSGLENRIDQWLQALGVGALVFFAESTAIPAFGLAAAGGGILFALTLIDNNITDPLPRLFYIVVLLAFIMYLFVKVQLLTRN
jgi:hypothetical protein